jgi:2',3'-cyclic-nucleotide 2'-phosphodiesterase (5'-nucleotidase family)
VKVQVVVIHEGASEGANRTADRPATPWAGPIIGITEELQNTTVDLVIAGHTHRAANTVVGRIPVVEGFNAGASYTVAQLMIRNGDVAWTGAATRAAKNLGVAARPDVQAIVDQANAETAVLRNQVIGTQSADILRGDNLPGGRAQESAMGNLVADAMRLKYPGVEAAITNSGGLRAELRFAPTGAEAPGEVTWGEVFQVLPFGNRTVIITLTGAQLEQAMLNGVSPACNSTIHSGRFPQVSGLRIEFSCSGTTPVIVSMSKAPEGPGGPLTPIGPTDTLRFVTNDFMLTGGDGYTAFLEATDVLQPGDGLMEVVVEYIGANSPVSATVQGRVPRR